MKTTKTLRAIVAKLKECSSLDNSITRESLRKKWEILRQQQWSVEKPHPAVVAGLILHDNAIAQLLNEAERAQLRTLIKAAIERYQEKINPPNKLGKTIAASLKETT